MSHDEGLPVCGARVGSWRGERRRGLAGITLEVFGRASAASVQAKVRSTMQRFNDEAMKLATRDDLDLPGSSACNRGGELRPAISGIREDVLDEGKETTRTTIEDEARPSRSRISAGRTTTFRRRRSASTGTCCLRSLRPHRLECRDHRGWRQRPEPPRGIQRWRSVLRKPRPSGWTSCPARAARRTRPRPRCPRCSMRAGSAAASMRNVLAHVGKQGRGVVAAFIGTAFAQDNAGAAGTRCRQVAD